MRNIDKYSNLTLVEAYKIALEENKLIVVHESSHESIYAVPRDNIKPQHLTEYCGDLRLLNRSKDKDQKAPSWNISIRDIERNDYKVIDWSSQELKEYFTT